MLLETAPDLYADTVVITSVNDGRHASASAHYSNDAWDVRTHPAGNKPRNGNILASNIDETAKYWVRALRRKLRLEYFVQYEQAKQHIHIQRAQLRS